MRRTARQVEFRTRLAHERFDYEGCVAKAGGAQRLQQLATEFVRDHQAHLGELRAAIARRDWVMLAERSVALHARLHPISGYRYHGMVLALRDLAQQRAFRHAQHVYRQLETELSELVFVLRTINSPPQAFN